jgi:hypothetical protein
MGECMGETGDCFPRGRFQSMMAPAAAMVKNLGQGKLAEARAEAKNGYRGAVCL